MIDNMQTRASLMRVALVTSAELPELDSESRALVGPLAERGVSAVPRVWNDPTVDWTSVDLAVIRSCWDYTACRAEFVAWARSVPRLANPADVIAWNTDKRYLREIASAGIPVVPTTWLAPDEHWSAARTGEW